MKRYAIGLDFGTLSVRALLVDKQTGREAATAVYAYPHGVMDKSLPDGTALPEGFALAHPQDYVDGMKAVVPQVLREAGIQGCDVAGIGLDCTSSTVMPVDAQGTPLCLSPKWAGHPHAYLKLWKHHGAEEQAALGRGGLNLSVDACLNFTLSPSARRANSPAPFDSGRSRRRSGSSSAPEPCPACASGGHQGVSAAPPAAPRWRPSIPGY